MDSAAWPRGRRPCLRGQGRQLSQRDLGGHGVSELKVTYQLMACLWGLLYALRGKLEKGCHVQ